jgi:hypothetical protein
MLGYILSTHLREEPMSSLRTIFTLLLAVLVLPNPTFVQTKNEKQPSEKFAIFIVSGSDDAAVTNALEQRLNDSKPFKTVLAEDASKATVVVDCMHRDKAEQPFICMYVSFYNGAAFKTLLGAGEYIGQTAEKVADNLLAAIASDIVERWGEADKLNMTESLEACLFLTDSKCNVPTSLQTQLGEKQLTLGQYLFKKNHH